MVAPCDRPGSGSLSSTNEDWSDRSCSGPDYLEISSSEELTDGHGERDVAGVVPLDQLAPEWG